LTTLFCIRPHGFNIGNDAIHLGLRNLIDEAFESVVNIVSLPAVSRYESHVKAGLTSRVIHEINQYGHGVIVGGGNLYENGELAVDANALSTLEPPLMLFSLSGGRIYNNQLDLVKRTDAMSSSTISALHDRADISLARDNATLKHLLGSGCDARLGACPTLFLDEIADYLPKLPVGSDSDVLISVRHPSLMNVPLFLQSRVQRDIESLIRSLQDKTGKTVRLLCHDHRDIPFAATFGEVDYVYTGDIYQYLSLLRNCHLNVSFRLHATLPCLAFGRPSISISYDERASSLLKTAGVEQWDINYVESTNVTDDVIARYERLDELQAGLVESKKCWHTFREFNRQVLSEFSADVRRYSAKQERH
jgi:hypothetical protein